MAHDTQADFGEGESQEKLLQCLQERREELVERRRTRQAYFSWCVGFLLACFSAGMLVTWWYSGINAYYIHVAIIAFLMSGIVAGLAVMLTIRTDLRDVNADIQDIDLRIDLSDYPVSPRETHAEKLLRLNDAQLRRYYDLNLSQNRWVFGLGIMCLALGTLIIAITLYLVLQTEVDKEARIITAVLGAVGAFLTNFVAAIYLKINASATETLAAFHSRLVETHQALFGNLLASRIEDDGTRWNTLEGLALHGAEPGKTDAQRIH